MILWSTVWQPIFSDKVIINFRNQLFSKYFILKVTNVQSYPLGGEHSHPSSITYQITVEIKHFIGLHLTQSEVELSFM